MAIDLEAQCDAVYTPWERHKLAVRGVQRLSLVTTFGAAALLASDLVLFRSWRPEGAANGTAARIGLGGVLLAGLIIFGLARRKRGDFSHPFRVAAGLLLGAVGLGAFAAAAAGGPSGYYAFGLLPLVFAWPVLMPGGVKEAVLPASAALVLHSVVLLVASSGGLGREGRVLVVALALSLAATVACGQVIETWRRKAAAASTTDWLTGALSREFLSERLKAMCAYRQRSLAPVSLVLLDVDRFKNINDAHGRNAGDEVLEMLVSGVLKEIRGNDFVGRYGGDQFLLVLDECEGEHAVSLVERLRRKVGDSPMTVGQEQVRVTFSAGIVSVAAGDSLVPTDLLRAVEKALTASKEAARNRTSLAATPAPQPDEPVTEP